MKGKRFTDERISGVLKEAEAGAKTMDLCRRYWISDATFYNWKAKYAGMTVSGARRLKELEHGNARLKRLLADAELDKAALKDLSGRNGRPAGEARGGHGVDDRARSGVTRACGLIGISRAL